MGIRIGRLGGALLLVGALVTTTPAPAAAESTLWTLTASPLAVTTGVSTTFSLTATNEDPLAALLSSSEIGCVVVDVPSNFIVAGAAVTGSSAGGSWGAALSGNRVKVRAGSGGDRLALLDWVSFTVTAMAHSTGSLAWNATAYRQQDCSGSGALLGVPPVVVVTGPTVTPTPTPTPKPTATQTPTPAPTPTPTPLLPLPTLALPSLGILPTPTPTPTLRPTPSAIPRSTPQGSPTPGAESVAPDPTEAPGGTDAAPSPSGSDGGAVRAPSAESGTGLPVGRALNAPLAIAFDPARLDVGTWGADVLVGQVDLFVPAAVIAGPGLLLLLLVALQAAGAMAWVPAVRRLRGEDAPPG